MLFFPHEISFYASFKAYSYVFTAQTTGLWKTPCDLLAQTRERTVLMILASKKPPEEFRTPLETSCLPIVVIFSVGVIQNGYFTVFVGLHWFNVSGSVLISSHPSLYPLPSSLPPSLRSFIHLYFSLSLSLSLSPPPSLSLSLPLSLFSPACETVDR